MDQATSADDDDADADKVNRGQLFVITRFGYHAKSRSIPFV
jgi:hypothetical protein